MARTAANKIVREGGEDRGADGRPSKQARISVLQEVVRTNREKIEEEETANATRRAVRKSVERGISILVTVCIDVEDRPSDRHNAVAQTTNGCCMDLYEMITIMDRSMLTTMTDEERLMCSYAEAPERPGVLLPLFPADEYQSVWDKVLGLDSTFVPEYLEVMHSVRPEEAFGPHAIMVNQLRSLMCQEVGVGEDDEQIVRFFDEMTSVQGAKALVVAQEVDTGVAGYAIVCLRGHWFVMHGKNINGLQGERDSLAPIPIGDGFIDVAKYLVEGPGAHLPQIYNGGPGELQTVTIVGFHEANWRRVEMRFDGLIREPAVVDSALENTLKRTRGVSHDAHPVDAKPCMRYWKFTRAGQGFHRREMQVNEMEPEDYDETGEESVMYEMEEIGDPERVMPAYLANV